MILQRAHGLPQLAWCFPFALFLVVVPVEAYVVIFLQLVSVPAVEGDFLGYQWFMSLWTEEGRLERGLPFEFMKVNALLVVYLWLMSRTMNRAEATHRFALAGAAWILLALQVLLAMPGDLTRARFVLVPIAG